MKLLLLATFALAGLMLVACPGHGGPDAGQGGFSNTSTAEAGGMPPCTLDDPGSKLDHCILQ